MTRKTTFDDDVNRAKYGTFQSIDVSRLNRKKNDDEDVELLSGKENSNDYLIIDTKAPSDNVLPVFLFNGETLPFVRSSYFTSMHPRSYMMNAAKRNTGYPIRDRYLFNRFGSLIHQGRISMKRASEEHEN